MILARVLKHVLLLFLPPPWKPSLVTRGWVASIQCNHCDYFIVWLCVLITVCITKIYLWRIYAFLTEYIKDYSAMWFTPSHSCHALLFMTLLSNPWYFFVSALLPDVWGGGGQLQKLGYGCYLSGLELFMYANSQLLKSTNTITVRPWFGSSMSLPACLSVLF